MKKNDLPIITPEQIQAIQEHADRSYAESIGMTYKELMEARMEAPRKALAKGDYSQYLCYFDSFKRFQGMLDIEGQVGSKEFARLFYDWYPNCDLDDANYEDDMQRIAHTYKKFWYDVSSEDDQRVFMRLRKQKSITVYRGGSVFDPIGTSWSLSEDVARRFAWHLVRYGGAYPKSHSVLLKATIDPMGFYVYMDGRSEQELLVDIDQLKDIRFKRFESKNWKLYKK